MAFAQSGIQCGQFCSVFTGHIILEHEQNGSLRAEYGKDILQDMWKRLQKALVTGLCAKSPADEEILSNVPRYERFAFAINMEAFLRVEKDLSRADEAKAAMERGKNTVLLYRV